MNMTSSVFFIVIVGSRSQHIMRNEYILLFIFPHSKYTYSFPIEFIVVVFFVFH